MTSKQAAEVLENVRNKFVEADSDGNGLLDQEEFGKLLSLLNKRLDPKRTEILFKAADKDGSGAVSTEEILNWILYGDAPPDPSNDELAQAFKKADKNGDGSLTKKEFVVFLRGLDPTWTQKKAMKLFKAADNDDSGKLDLSEIQVWYKKFKKQSEAEEHPVGEEGLYNLLQMKENRVMTRVRIGDLCEAFAFCKAGGLGPRVAKLIPQKCGNADKAEDLSPLEMAHLWALVNTNREATEEEARLKVYDEKALCRNAESQTDLEAINIDPDAVVGFGVFIQLLTMLTATMCIERGYIMSAFAWSKCDCFEMPESMAIAVMQRLFLKIPKDGLPILKEKVSSNDFARLCFSMNLVDASGANGIAHGRIAILFQDVIKTLPKRLSDRQRLWHQARNAYEDKAKFNDKDSDKKLKRDYISGREELSCLMEALQLALAMAKKYR
eukprot:CAMPEP_0197682144 /NCGR_PEP_ID=MMETSP1338-20131121/96034_1 /TAXON_ID=43686 ORGANISM="Pelagodinium beii, Strain RCC1491" /NCGR_SAMPLE_ID=MMETSP1338 /ASSEMBLY_ACC=CAM_ASM_000754 /LENGTH=439 /DNA_ID=CAMNT_0043263573 /DNA_START=31 /DNA_END=1347 /DNA_ORIENTATION=+